MASFRDEPDQSPYKDSGPDTNGDYKDAINQVRSAGSVVITSELFEKLYLSPQKPMKDGRAKTFGNPTPMYEYSAVWLPSYSFSPNVFKLFSDTSP